MVLVFQPLMSLGDQRRNLPITVTVEQSPTDDIFYRVSFVLQ